MGSLSPLLPASCDWAPTLDCQPFNVRESATDNLSVPSAVLISVEAVCVVLHYIACVPTVPK